MYAWAKISEILTAVMVVIFGTSAWAALGGLWVELPLLTNLGVPEGYRIGSHVIIIMQAAIIGPLLFAALQLLAPKRYRLEIPAIYVILAVGAIASFLMIFFWDAHSIWEIDYEEHSTALLILSFFMALVDSTSNLTFMPFVSSLEAMYLNWYFIGEGLSSVIPSLVVLIQGAGGLDQCKASNTFTNTSLNPITNVTIVQNCTELILDRGSGALFSPEYYYFFMFLLLLSSMTSFTLLRCHPFFRGQYDNYENVDDNTNDSKWCDCFTGCRKRRHGDTEKTPLLSTSKENNISDKHECLATDQTVKNNVPEVTDQNHSPDLTQSTRIHPELCEQETTLTIPTITPEADSSENSKNPDKSTSSSTARCIFLFVILTTISATTYGVLPSIQSFSAGSYGPEVYLLVAACAEMSVPVGFFLVLIRPSTSDLVVLLTSVGGLVSGAYCMSVAVLSPSPPLVDSILGKLIIILAWVLQGLFFSYCRATIGWILRGEARSRVLMMGFGACTTFGTMLGAVVMFPIVNVLEVFEDVDPNMGCPSNLTCTVMEYNITLSDLNI